MKTFNFRRLRSKSAMTFALVVACVLVTGNCSPVTAQVAIGGDGTVTPGALLDLSQVTDVGGLLLPQIVSADTLTAVLRKPGMLVYNKTDGKIYAYNGSVWSAGGGSGGSGGGGGGGEPDPTPSPKTCGGSVMGVSGTLYPIGSYPYAQNDLKNLCWTLTNLKEAGQTQTDYPGKSENRGYYYELARAPVTGPDVCSEKLGSAWRVPTKADWELLKNGFADLVASEREPWVTAPASLGGYIHYQQYTPLYEGKFWDICSVYLVKAGWGELVYQGMGVLRLNPDTSMSYFQVDTTDRDYHYLSVRCVRDL